MIDGGFRRQPHIGVDCQQFLHKIFTHVRYGSPSLCLHHILAVQDLVQQHIFWSAERCSSAQQHERHYAKRPHVTLSSVTITVGSRDNFGSNIGHRPTGCSELPGIVPTLGKAKINQFELCSLLLVLVEEIFELDVPMSNILPMQIAQRKNHLLNSNGSVHLRVPFHLSEPVKKLLSRAQFHHKVNKSVFLVHIAEPANVRVVQLEENKRFVSKHVQFAAILLDNLDRLQSILASVMYSDTKSYWPCVARPKYNALHFVVCGESL
mmetsp:Transcript_11243/g.24826  ORF Transcript_11243/g.24826 Transcript_11243/m.24826 type:complete len:265 (+) Transcript_11243:954-1748(+)